MGPDQCVQRSSFTVSFRCRLTEGLRDTCMDLLLLWSPTGPRDLWDSSWHMHAVRSLPGELQRPAAEQLLGSEKEESLLPRYYILHAK